MHQYYLSVRGYELDSFGHVNNAVYLNYIEQARWQLLQDLKLLDYFMENSLFLVVIEVNIKYIKELKFFDEVVVRTTVSKEAPYVMFNQDIYDTKTNIRVTKAKVKTLLIDKERIAVDFPDSLLSKMRDFAVLPDN